MDGAMKLARRKCLHLATGAAALPAISRMAKAQAYPLRPITLVVPFAPGGANDVIGRVLAKGNPTNGRGDNPNEHDALTGSTMDGRAFPAGEDRTCKNWTSSTQGSAMLGHIDRERLHDDEKSKSWNASHPSRGSDAGCSQADLRSTGGAGLFYCFAIN